MTFLVTWAVIARVEINTWCLTEAQTGLSQKLIPPFPPAPTQSTDAIIPCQVVQGGWLAVASPASTWKPILDCP